MGLGELARQELRASERAGLSRKVFLEDALHICLYACPCVISVVGMEQRAVEKVGVKILDSCKSCRLETIWYSQSF